MSGAIRSAAAERSRRNTGWARARKYLDRAGWLIAAAVIYAVGAMWVDVNLAQTSVLEAVKLAALQMGGGMMVNIGTRDGSLKTGNPTGAPART